jgi:predicted MFS family arabinose efflux permease
VDGAGPASPIEGAGSGGRRPPLYTRTFGGILLTNLLAFGQWFSLQPVIPLLVLELGGDATMAGLAFAFYSIPSVISRPFIGRLVDQLGTRIMLIAGTVGMAVVAPVYLFPSILLLLAVRVVHGIFWSATMTAAPTLMARLAPATRRGEAASIFDLMPSLAQTVAPAIGVLVLATASWTGVFTLATILPLAACGLVLLTVPADRPAARPTTGSSLPLLEPSALLPMAIAMLFMLASPLFVVYPPILAREQGIPVTDLAIYYPVYGTFMVGSRVVIGRFLDRLPRLRIFVVAGLLAIVALGITIGAHSIGPLAAGAAMYATAVGIAVPAMTATVIDRAPPGRVGSAMGTYTLGYQFASGFGAAIWGFVIGQAGFPPAYVAAAVVQVALIVMVIQARSRLQRPLPAPAAGPDAP